MPVIYALIYSPRDLQAQRTRCPEALIDTESHIKSYNHNLISLTLTFYSRAMRGTQMISRHLHISGKHCGLYEYPPSRKVRAVGI